MNNYFKYSNTTTSRAPAINEVTQQAMRLCDAGCITDTHFEAKIIYLFTQTDMMEIVNVVQNQNH
jgi:hypothetical protein